MNKEKYVILSEPASNSILNRVVWVRKRTKAFIEGIVVAQGLDATYTGDVARPATNEEVEMAEELAKMNRPPCPICKRLMTVGMAVLYEGVTPWRCEEHGIPEDV